MKPPIQTSAKIASSALFDGSASSMARTPGVNGSGTIWTFSCWFKYFTPGIDVNFMHAYLDSSNEEFIGLTGDKLHLKLILSTFTQYEKLTTALFRDPACHYHICISRSGSTIVVEVNGKVITAFDTDADDPSDGLFNRTFTQNIGRKYRLISPIDYHDGLMSEIYMLDGTVKSASDFGEYNEAGVWVPKLAANQLMIDSVFGTNGFYLKSNGTDLSGNGNDYTETSMATDADTPTNNLARLSSIDISPGLNNANLSGNAAKNSSATMGISKGRIYWEIVAAATTQFGVIDDNGTKNTANPGAATYGVRLDMDAGTLDYWTGGSWTSIATGLTGTQRPHSNTNTSTYNFGGSAYSYTPPDGYKNLTAENVGAGSVKRPSKGFKAITYVGNGLAGREVSGLEFQPGIVLIKDRDNAETWVLTDSERGINNQVNLPDAFVESEHKNMLTAINARGFDVGTHDLVNKSSINYMAFCFKKDASFGIDIVSYTGDGVGGHDVSHNLGAAPELIIVFRLLNDTSGRAPVYVASRGNNSFFYLGQNIAQQTDANIWDTTTPTSSVFTVGANAASNNSAEEYIAYLFSSKPGFSKIFEYTGNNNSDGPFVFCGFKPAFLIIKRTNSTGSWHIFNSTSSQGNPVDDFLITDAADAEVTGSASYIVDILSNGFKIRWNGVDINANAAPYIGIAFAEIPLEHAHAA